MANWNLGSVATEVLLIVENVPTSMPTLSGIPLMNMAERNIDLIERYTGESIGSISIPLKYQGALVDLTVADVLDFMNITGGDASSYSIEGFSVTKGGESNLEMVSKKFRENGFKRIQQIGRHISFYVSNG
jgi:hypothetical protein